jgi:hypothetical protein
VIALALRLVWCGLAGATLVVAVRVWWPIHVAARVAAGGDDERLRVWSASLARALAGLVVVAACNLAAGLYSAALPVRPDARERGRRTLVDWAPVVVPVLFIVSAATKLAIVLGVWRAYRRVVAAPRRRHW